MGFESVDDNVSESEIELIEEIEVIEENVSSLLFV